MFAANDQMALGALRAYSEAGLRVPRRSALLALTTSRRPRTSSRP
ncbi:substrate-binding domain-containing protein [Arthrobacter sp. D1-17]